MKNFLQSKPARVALWGLGGLAVLLVVFGAGVAVGYRGGLFSSRFGQDYYRNFIGMGHGGMMTVRMAGGVMPPSAANMYGITGTVIAVGSSTIAVQDSAGDEQSVAIDGNTVIREGDMTIFVADIKDGNGVAVIGAPNNAGQVQARFIRVFDTRSSIPEAPGGQ